MEIPEERFVSLFYCDVVLNLQKQHNEILIIMILCTRFLMASFNSSLKYKLKFSQNIIYNEAF